MQGRSLIAICIGKFCMNLIRLSGRGAGTSLPGYLVQHIDRNFLQNLSKQVRQGTVLVTGTNGKTTTTKMIVQILERAQYKCINNYSGANLMNGIVTSLLEEASWQGKVQADYAVFEVDEATMPLVVSPTRPQLTVVTNFFRDQLDRYGELDHTRDLINTALTQVAPAGCLVLNADDPLVASLGTHYPQTIYYGIEEECRNLPKASLVSDVKYCVNCKECPYRYQQVYYSHLGKYCCPKCGHRRPHPQISARHIKLKGVHGSEAEIMTPQGDFTLTLRVPGFYNLYNALAATACCLALGIDQETIRAALNDFTAHFGRMEEIEIDGRKVLMTLIKNPTGYNETLRAIFSDGQPKNLFMALNDNEADGEDVSWIWDVDFETFLADHTKLNFVIVTGLRAEDMALRLKYANVPPAKISIAKDYQTALQDGVARVAPGGMLNILPTYTAMLAIRDCIVRAGYAKAYWQK